MGKVGRPRFKATKEQVLSAIKASYGNRSTIASRLGCDWSTGNRLIHKWRETELAFFNEKQIVNDVAESKAFKLIMDGDAGMIKWWLSKQAKDRGYGEEAQLDITGQTDNTLKIIIDDD